MNNNFKYNIRKFRIEDYDKILSLWRKSELTFKAKGRDRYAKIKDELEIGNGFFYVAELDEKLVGSIFGTHDGRKGWVNRLAVDPSFRNRGIGRFLVEKVEKDLSDIGIDIIGVLVEGWNYESMNFFRNIGYEESDIVYFSKRKNSFS
jgi:ribosomal protein S18 acetylase RimI-like enzyme